ncbi:TM2 domain-containing protein [Corynebacterium sp. H113]|uniref:TM2 domain-containing protein n=1 Tax=Corynebacterium sp. H113 TaxID=3133419 RepID=UPI0030A2DC4A
MTDPFNGQQYDKNGLPINNAGAGGYGQPYAQPQQGYGQPYGAAQQPYGQPYGAQQPYGAMAPMNAYGAPGMPGGPMMSDKSKIVAALLAFFLGGFGVHNFYLGKTNVAVTQLVLYLIGLATAFIFIGFFILVPLGIWIFVEFILILMGSGQYAYDGQGRLLQS